MRQIARHRRACRRAWIGLWLILLNVLAAPLAPSPVIAARAPAGAPATLDGLPYVICGMGGMISPDQPGQSDQAPAHAPDICAFCLPMLHGAAALPVPPPLPGPPTIAITTHAPTPPAQAPPARIVVRANGARAPPV